MSVLGSDESMYVCLSSSMYVAINAWVYVNV